MIRAPNEKPMRPGDVREAVVIHQQRSKTIKVKTNLLTGRWPALLLRRHSAKNTPASSDLSAARVHFSSIFDQKKEDVR